jgi:hypothetical protein
VLTGYAGLRLRTEHTGAADERCHAVLRTYFQVLKDDPGAARLFVLEISRVGPAVDEVGAALLREFGELLSRTLVPNAGARLKRGAGARRRRRRGTGDHESLDSQRLCEERGRGRNRRTEDLPRAGGVTRRWGLPVVGALETGFNASSRRHPGLCALTAAGGSRPADVGQSMSPTGAVAGNLQKCSKMGIFHCP